jgi:uncharacterized protein (DUF58 family)
MLDLVKRTFGRSQRQEHKLRARASSRSQLRGATHGAKHVSPEVLKQVRLLELKTRGLVHSLFAGEYRSVFKGQGMDFAEVREYQPGDEVRSIDWNVTARMRKPFVKRYVEERELTVMLAMDVSGSEQFGTVSRFKSEALMEFATLIAMSAVRNNDRVGMMFFTDRVEYVVPPKKGKRHALRMVRDLLTFTPQGKETNLVPALQQLNQTLRQHTVVFVVSDFVAKGYERALKLLAQRHDVIAVPVNDPSEKTLPDIGVARLVDPETGVYFEIDTSSTAVRNAYSKHMETESAARHQTFTRLGVDEIPLSTTRAAIEPLLKFFRSRQTRLRR